MTQKERIKLTIELAKALRKISGDVKKLEEARQILIKLNSLLLDALKEAETAEEAFEWHQELFSAAGAIKTRV